MGSKPRDGRFGGGSFDPHFQPARQFIEKDRDQRASPSPRAPPRLHEPRGVAGHLVDFDVDLVAGPLSSL
jgi:hypothetical protein